MITLKDAQSSIIFESKNKMVDKTNVFVAFFALILLTHVSKSNANFNTYYPMDFNETQESVNSVDGNDVAPSDIVNLNVIDSRIKTWNLWSCTLPKEELLDLKKTLENTVEGLLPYEYRLRHCKNGDVIDVGVVDGDLCDQSVCEVINKANHVLEKIDFLNQTESIDTGRTDLLQLVDLEGHALQGNQKNRKTMAAGGLKKELEERETTSVENCSSKLVESQNETRSLKSEIEMLRGKLKDKSFEMCADLIRKGEHDLALIKFNELGVVSDLDMLRIVKLAYDGEVTNMEKILEFIKMKIPSWREVQAYSALLETIKENGDTSDPRFLVFHHEIQKDTLRFASIVDKSHPYVNSILSAWANNVHDGHYQELKDFSDQHFPAFDSHFPGLIKILYNNKLENAGKAMSFIQFLDEASKEATGDLALFEEMKRNGHLVSSELVRLACHVKDNARNFDSNFYNIDTIRKGLPESVRHLLFDKDSPVIMESQEHVGYRLSGDEDYNVYTYKQDGYDAREVWDVEVEMEGEKCFFSFKNLEHDRQLCTLSSEPLFLTIEKDPEDLATALWEVTPVEDGTYVYLKNKENGRIIDANILVAYGYLGTCCRTEVRAYESYTGNSSQHWKIL